MKLSKRDVNLILGILSLILLVAFIFFFYSPKHEQYKEELAALEPLRTGFKDVKVELSKLPALKENLAAYQEKLDGKRRKEMEEKPVEEDKEQLNENQLLITLEEIADRTQIDMDLRKSTGVSQQPALTPVGPNGQPVPPATNPDGTPVTPEVTPPTDAATGEAPATGETTPPPSNEVVISPPGQMGQENSYSFSLKGEYRSVMIFLFEIRNLEHPAIVSNFELKYNEEISKEKGFPLQASFSATFGEPSNPQGGEFPR